MPRTKLGAVPYAIEAERAQTANAANNAVGPLLARIAALEAQASVDCPPGWTLDTRCRGCCGRRCAAGTGARAV